MPNAFIQGRDLLAEVGGVRLDCEESGDGGDELLIVFRADTFYLCVLCLDKPLKVTQIDLLLSVCMDLFDNGTKLFQVLGGGGCIEEMYLLELLVDAFLSVLLTTSRWHYYMLQSILSGCLTTALDPNTVMGTCLEPSGSEPARTLVFNPVS